MDNDNPISKACKTAKKSVKKLRTPLLQFNFTSLRGNGSAEKRHSEYQNNHSTAAFNSPNP